MHITDAPALTGRLKALPPFIPDVKLRALKSPSLLVRGNGTESVFAACISCKVRLSVGENYSVKKRSKVVVVKEKEESLHWAA